MWWVSSWTVGISLSGICPEPPSPQQLRQHVNIAAILPLTHIRKPTNIIKPKSCWEVKMADLAKHNSDTPRRTMALHNLPTSPTVSNHSSYDRQLLLMAWKQGKKIKVKNSTRDYVTIGYRCYITTSQTTVCFRKCLARLGDKCWIDQQ